MNWAWIISKIKFAVLISLVIFSCGGNEVVEEVIRPVRYVEVFSMGGNRVRTFSGVAQAGVESNLSFKVAGTVEKLFVKVGDKVKSGQLIAQLDPTDYQLQLQQAQAALQQAKAQARNAAAAYERAMQLYENRNISKSDLDAARAASESATAAVRSMEKQAELSQRQSDYTRLRAPIKGAIATVNCEINENVRAGETIVSLSSASQIEVDISLPGILITQIREGQGVTVVFDAIQGKEFEATITEVGVAAVDMAAAFPVTIRLNRTDPEVRPGMAASVSIEFESSDKKERFIVPTSAVLEDRQGRFVFVVKPISEEPEFGMIHRRPVSVGELTTEGLELLQGLKDGDKVVTAGVSRITDGQKVRL
jgi:RND family efflux transporter MFP subunit